MGVVDGVFAAEADEEVLIEIGHAHDFVRNNLEKRASNMFRCAARLKMISGQGWKGGEGGERDGDNGGQWVGHLLRAVC